MGVLLWSGKATAGSIPFSPRIVSISSFQRWSISEKISPPMENISTRHGTIRGGCVSRNSFREVVGLFFSSLYLFRILSVFLYEGVVLTNCQGDIVGAHLKRRRSVLRYNFHCKEQEHRDDVCIGKGASLKMIVVWHGIWIGCS